MASLVTPDLVQEVARTSAPLELFGWKLTVARIIRMTGGSDWNHSFLTLKSTAARRVAKELNEAAPWEKTKKRLALPVEPEVLHGELTDTIPIGATKVTPLTAGIPARKSS